MSLLFAIFLYNIHSCVKSLIVGSKFRQISFTYSRNRSGPNTLPCGTSDVTVTFSDTCPPTLTLCERPYRNSLTRTNTLESTPEAAIFISSRSYATKSKAFATSIIIVSLLALSSRESTKSWQNVATWLSHGDPGLNPCWPSTCLGCPVIWSVLFAGRLLRLSWLFCCLWPQILVLPGK